VVFKHPKTGPFVRKETTRNLHKSEF